MNTDRDWKRRKVEIVLIVLIILIGWYISRPHAPDAPRAPLHWISAVLAAWFLGSSAWSIITKPNRIFLALGYLSFGISMSLQFISDLAPQAKASILETTTILALSVGTLLFATDHQKHDSSAPS